MSQLLTGTDPQAISTAAALLRAGEVVAFPTETVYGLGANALNEAAVAQVFAIKNRPYFDPLIVHVPAKDVVALYATNIDERAMVLMEHFWPGPLTLVLRKRSNIPDLVTAGLDTVAIRVPAHPVALALLRTAQVPVAAPSANPFGYVSPTTAQHVEELLGHAVPLVLDGGPCTVGVESTVCALTETQAVILRPGGIPVEAIEAIIGPVAFASPTQADVRSPGTLLSHYAPHVRLQLLAPGEPIPHVGENKRVGLLLFKPRPHVAGYAMTEILSQHGNLTEAAANLFAALRRIDVAGLDYVIVEPAPEYGLGRAIMDRLRRAAGSIGSLDH